MPRSRNEKEVWQKGVCRMSKMYYLICILFSGFFAVYFIATKQWFGAFTQIALNLLSIKALFMMSK